MKVFIASIEFNLCETHPEYGNLRGGFVYILVLSSNKKEAKSIILESLEKELLVLKTFESIELYSELEWEMEEDQKHFDQLAQRAMVCNETIFDDYYMYENE